MRNILFALTISNPRTHPLNTSVFSLQTRIDFRIMAVVRPFFLVIGIWAETPEHSQQYTFKASIIESSEQWTENLIMIQRKILNAQQKLRTKLRWTGNNEYVTIIWA